MARYCATAKYVFLFDIETVYFFAYNLAYIFIFIQVFSAFLEFLEACARVTYYRAKYERNNKRVKSFLGKRMKTLRSSTVEPVFGGLTQYFGMRKVNTKGIKQANKVMQMAATAYNLKKLLKFIHKTTQAKKQGMRARFYRIYHRLSVQISPFRGFFRSLTIKISFN